MNVLNFVNDFFSDSAHWHGYDGIPTRLAEHLTYSLEALALAAVIGLPVGLVTGHYGRGGNALALIATAAATQAVATPQVHQRSPPPALRTLK